MADALADGVPFLLSDVSASAIERLLVDPERVAVEIERKVSSAPLSARA